MAAKKARFSKDDIEFCLNDYRSEEYVKTSADVDKVMNARWKLFEKVRSAHGAAESSEVKQALKFAMDVVIDEIKALAFLSGAKKQLEEPHIAAWINLSDKVERLSEELDRVASRVPEEHY
jgi:hypothetical protein